MPTPRLILQAVPAFGPDIAKRYVIRNVDDDFVWTGNGFSRDWDDGLKYATPNAACVDMQELLKEVYGELPVKRYRAPVEVEVYGDVPVEDVIQWLVQASILNLRTHECDNGPEGSLVLPVLR